MNYSKANCVIIFDPNKSSFLTNPDNSEYITLVESMNNERKTITLIWILYQILILEKWVEEDDLNKNILLVMSLARYSNNELALQ